MRCSNEALLSVKHDNTMEGQLKLCYIDYADSLYRNATIKNGSATSKAYVGDNGVTLCTIVIPISICFTAFQYIRICQRNTAFYPNLWWRWRSRRLETPLSWNICSAKNVWIFHIPSSIHFTGRKNCWLNAAMSCRVVHNQYRHCMRLGVAVLNGL